MTVCHRQGLRGPSTGGVKSNKKTSSAIAEKKGLKTNKGSTSPRPVKGGKTTGRCSSVVTGRLLRLADYYVQGEGTERAGCGRRRPGLISESRRYSDVASSKRKVLQKGRAGPELLNPAHHHEKKKVTQRRHLAIRTSTEANSNHREFERNRGNLTRMQHDTDGFRKVKKTRRSLTKNQWVLRQVIWRDGGLYSRDLHQRVWGETSVDAGIRATLLLNGLKERLREKENPKSDCRKRIGATLHGAN